MKEHFKYFLFMLPQTALKENPGRSVISVREAVEEAQTSTADRLEPAVLYVVLEPITCQSLRAAGADLSSQEMFVHQASPLF